MACQATPLQQRHCIIINDPHYLHEQGMVCWPNGACGAPLSVCMCDAVLKVQARMGSMPCGSCSPCLVVVCVITDIQMEVVKKASAPPRLVERFHCR